MDGKLSLKGAWLGHVNRLNFIENCKALIRSGTDQFSNSCSFYDCERRHMTLTFEVDLYTEKMNRRAGYPVQM